jgi:hypothetical protein
MPKIPHFAFKYEYQGCARQLLSSIEVFALENHALRKTYIGVWDTGATQTLITQKIFTDLNLTPIDNAIVAGVNSKTIAPVVLIGLILPNNIQIKGIRATVSHIQGVDMLLGMDLIQLGDFSISNHDNKTVFTFAIPPFENRTDLFKKAVAVNKRNKNKH